MLGNVGCSPLPADLITVQFATMQFHFTSEFHHYMEGNVAFHCELNIYIFINETEIKLTIFSTLVYFAQYC